MILNKHTVALFFATVLLVPHLKAGEPCRKFLGYPVPDCIGKWCCDDYKPKCLPCVKVPLCFGCDDYCRKSMPRVCTPLCFTCDDYCKKCQPPACRPPLLSTLRCVPKCGASRCTTCSPSSCDQGNAMINEPTLPSMPRVQVANPQSPIRTVATEAVGIKTKAVEPGGQDARRPVIIELLQR